MSDTSQGPGWWLASDGKWYPPQSAAPTAPPTAPIPTPPGYPQPQPQAPMYYPPVGPKTEGMAVASLVCGITALPMLIACGTGVILGILGVVFGIVGIRKIDQSGGTLGGRGMALAGAICGGVAIALLVAYIVFAVIVSASN